MEQQFKNDLLSTLEKDKESLKKEFEPFNKEQEKIIEKYKKKLSDEKDLLKKEQNNLYALLSISKTDFKKDKKNIKDKRKKAKIAVNDRVFRISKIRLSIDEANKKIKDNNSTLNEKIDKLVRHINEYLLSTEQHDLYIIKFLTISALKTKIKITIKQYDIEKIPSNPRIGMSLGTNFKPRVFVSTNAKTRTKKVITRDETFAIHPLDNPDIRLKEISEYLGIIDPYNLYEYFFNNLKKYQGKQYIDHFFKS